MVKFLRRDWKRYSKLGKGRKKKQVWRRPTGRDNKMREKRKGYPVRVSVGYKNADKEQMIKIGSLEELNKVAKGVTVILGKMGMKKKLEMIKVAKEKGIRVDNLNLKSMLKKKKKLEKKREKVKKKVEVKEKAVKKEKKAVKEDVKEKPDTKEPNVEEKKHTLKEGTSTGEGER